MWSQTLEHEAHVVVDEQDRDAAGAQRRAAARRAGALSVGVETGGRLVEQEQPGSCGERRATPTSLRWPWEISVGARSARSARPSASSASSTAAAARASTAARRASATAPPRRALRRRPAGCRARTGRRRARGTGTSGRDRAAPVDAGQPATVVPSNVMLPVLVGTKPGIASTRVVLPAPFGPMSPTNWPGSTVERGVVDGPHAAVLDREVTAVQERRSPGGSNAERLAPVGLPAWGSSPAASATQATREALGVQATDVTTSATPPMNSSVPGADAVPVAAMP